MEIHVNDFKHISSFLLQGMQKNAFDPGDIPYIANLIQKLNGIYDQFQKSQQIKEEEKRKQDVV